MWSLFFLIAGLIIGLGAVTVIDIHGFLAQNSAYWTKATIQTHKVTKLLIWLGFFLALVGGIWYYQSFGFVWFVNVQLALLLPLLANGLYLSFYISPYLLVKEKEGKSMDLLPQSMQRAIRVSFIGSFVGWWGSVGILVYSLVV